MTYNLARMWFYCWPKASFLKFLNQCCCYLDIFTQNKSRGSVVQWKLKEVQTLFEM